MLSDACFEFRMEVLRAGASEEVLDTLLRDIDHYGSEPFDYADELIQRLRALTTRTRKLLDTSLESDAQEADFLWAASLLLDYTSLVRVFMDSMGAQSSGLTVLEQEIDDYLSGSSAHPASAEQGVSDGANPGGSGILSMR